MASCRFYRLLGVNDDKPCCLVEGGTLRIWGKMAILCEWDVRGTHYRGRTRAAKTVPERRAARQALSRRRLRFRPEYARRPQTRRGRGGRGRCRREFSVGNAALSRALRFRTKMESLSVQSIRTQSCRPGL